MVDRDVGLVPPVHILAPLLFPQPHFQKPPLVPAHCRATITRPEVPSVLAQSTGPHWCASPASSWVADQCILGVVMRWGELDSQVCIFSVSQPNWKCKQPAVPSKSGQVELMGFWQ